MSKRELGDIGGASLDPDAPRAKRRKEGAAASPPHDQVTAQTTNTPGTKSEDEGQDIGGAGLGDETVKEQGLQLWQTIKDAVNKEGRTLSVDFLRLPSRRQYPAYYTQIKRPIALDDIKTNLNSGAYSSFEEVKQDFETCFVNAKRFNIKESQIWKDAKSLHKLVKKEYASMTGTGEDDDIDHAADGDGGGDGGDASGDEGDKKKSKGKAPNMNRLLKGRLQKLVDKTDDSGRVLSEVFMELPNKKQWSIYYKTIKRPQCIENIFKHLKRKEYHTPAEFARDVELVFSNAMEFNQDHTPIWEDAKVLRDYFRQLMSDLPPPYSLPEYSQPVKEPATHSTAKIKLKVPGAAPTAASPPVPADAPQPTNNPLLFRLPSMHGQGTSQGSSKSPANQSSVLPTPPAASSTIPLPQHPTPPTPAETPVQATSGATTYAHHYPNAIYQQTAASPVTRAPSLPAPTPNIPTAGPSTRPSATSQSMSHSPAPSTHRHRPLQHVCLTTKPLGRRLVLDYRDGVKSWSLRLVGGESGVVVAQVKFVGNEEEESSDEEKHPDEPGEDATPQIVKAKRGRGRPRKKPLVEVKVDPPPKVTNGKIPHKVPRGTEDVVVKLNGSLVDTSTPGEWDVDLPVGSNALEVGEKGGSVWKVYLERMIA
ncbi:hypothetical protein JAAARDRAFT_147324 [Jaapia argillacea MUCL 33604]|uniref:Bromo domain-containing protein n=1 Tax=Jaapia argillacea MUCL 33604 TaxID=933084 RepID=A0A067QAN4_9AGAM|nr:hypothetical protein JAAARDRAFT_147324 [Jaapia argillacea MUCL 33604]